MLTDAERRIRWREVRQILGFDSKDWPDALTIGQISALQTCPHLAAPWTEYAEACNKFAIFLFAEWKADRLKWRGESFPGSQVRVKEQSSFAHYWKCELLKAAMSTGRTGLPVFYLEDATYLFRDIEPSKFIAPWLDPASADRLEGSESRTHDDGDIVLKRHDLLDKLTKTYPELESAFKRNDKWLRNCGTGTHGYYSLKKVQAACDARWPRRQATLQPNPSRLSIVGQLSTGE